MTDMMEVQHKIALFHANAHRVDRHYRTTLGGKRKGEIIWPPQTTPVAERINAALNTEAGGSMVENPTVHLIFWSVMTLYWVALAIGSMVFAILAHHWLPLMFAALGVFGACIYGAIALEGP